MGDADGIMPKDRETLETYKDGRWDNRNELLLTVVAEICQDGVTGQRKLRNF